MYPKDNIFDPVKAETASAVLMREILTDMRNKLSNTIFDEYLNPACQKRLNRLKADTGKLIEFTFDYAYAQVNEVKNEDMDEGIYALEDI